MPILILEKLQTSLQQLAHDSWFFGPGGSHPKHPTSKNKATVKEVKFEGKPILKVTYSYGGPEEDILFDAMRRLGYRQQKDTDTISIVGSKTSLFRHWDAIDGVSPTVTTKEVD